jgi:PIN domain nuclease of toxin-antitoxin system
MNVLLDTCAVLAPADAELPAATARALRKAPQAWVSVVRPWEVAIKAETSRPRERRQAECDARGLPQAQRLTPARFAAVRRGPSLQPNTSLRRSDNSR